MRRENEEIHGEIQTIHILAQTQKANTSPPGTSDQFSRKGVVFLWIVGADANNGKSLVEHFGYL
jgi:hypothetical protein